VLDVEPNVESSADIDIGKMYRERRGEFESLAKSNADKSYQTAVNHPLYPKLKLHGNVF